MSHNAAAGGATHLDFDLHGIVGVRLVDPSTAAAQAVQSQLPGMARPLQRAPDIEVRFEPHLDTRALRYVNKGHSGYTEHDYFVLSHRRRPVLLRLPFDQLDGPCLLQCDAAAASVPLLDELIQLAVLRKGYVPLHASAFAYRGHGVIVAAGAHGGKTSCLLAFAQHGAHYISDDLALLSADGSAMRGIPSPIFAADWQLQQLAGGAARVRGVRRVLSGVVRHIGRRQQYVPSRTLRGALQRALPAVQRRLKVQLAPQALFEDTVAGAAPVNTVFLALTHAAPEIIVEAADPAVVARQLATALRLQLHACFEHYLAFRFAFPSRRCTLLDNAEARAAELLQTALAQLDVFVVMHPHPMSLPALYQAMRGQVELPSAVRTPGTRLEPQLV